jgi:hypothetical protein
MKDFETYIESKNPELYHEVFGIGKKKIVGDVDERQERAKNTVRAQGDYVIEWIKKGLEDHLEKINIGSKRITIDVRKSFNTDTGIIYVDIHEKTQPIETDKWDDQYKKQKRAGLWPYNCQITFKYKGNWAANNLPTLHGGSIKEVEVLLSGGNRPGNIYDLSEKGVIKKILVYLIYFIANDIKKSSLPSADFLSSEMEDIELNVPPPPAGAKGAKLQAIGKEFNKRYV